MSINMISENIQIDIKERLARVEKEHPVKVLLAVESGSRAWGFASPNSDYDVRFIYVNRPDWYLSVGLEEQRDVIEYPIVDDIDINGWDLRKALRLFWKSNPTFFEWMQSPIVYKHEGSFAEAARHLLPRTYSCTRGIHHYRSMAKASYRGYLREDMVLLKKYFYVLRPLLSVRWLEKHGSPAPIEFQQLLSLIPHQMRLLEAINNLLALKRKSPELGLSPRIPEIHSFIEQELERLEGVTPEQEERKSDVDELSSLFRRVLEETWRS